MKLHLVKCVNFKIVPQLTLRNYLKIHTLHRVQFQEPNYPKQPQWFDFEISSPSGQKFQSQTIGFA